MDNAPELPPEVIGVITHREGIFWRVPELSEETACAGCVTFTNSPLCKSLPLCGGDEGSIFIRPETINEYRIARVAAKLRR